LGNVQEAKKGHLSRAKPFYNYGEWAKDVSKPQKLSGEHYYVWRLVFWAIFASVAGSPSG
jgi:hypothetical protein